MKPPITYYGGKQRLIKELSELLPHHRHYIEPFMGGGALFFAKTPSPSETINDLNGEVINFYKMVKTRFEELKKEVAGTLHSRSTYTEAMAIYRKKTEASEIKRAWAFWVVTNQGFSSRIGSWALGKDNKVSKTLHNKKENFIADYAKRLENVQIECGDALKIIEQYDSPDAFFYLDPPYFNSDCGHYKGYSENDYKKLLDKLLTIKGKFLLSSYPSELLNNYCHSKGWNIKQKKQKVNVSHKIKKEKTEVMVYNYLIKDQSACNKSDKEASEAKNFILRKMRPIKNALSLPVRHNNGKFACSVPKPLIASPLELITEKTSLEMKTKHQEKKKRTEQSGTTTQNKRDEIPSLEIIHEHKLLFKTPNNHYYVLGAPGQDMASLSITLMVEELSCNRKERIKIDLYNRDSVQHYSRVLSEQFCQDQQVFETEFLQLTNLLEKHRDKEYRFQHTQTLPKRAVLQMPVKEQQKCLDFLTAPDLIPGIDALIQRAGVVGEERARKLLFIIASSYKMPSALHLLLRGSQSSGKSHLINTIAGCFPGQDVMNLTRVSSKSFYHYNKEELVGKLMLIQDYDSLDEEARFAFRELQTQGNIHFSTTRKDKFGTILSVVKTVKSHFASLVVTANEGLYYEKMSPWLISSLDETDEQTRRIIEYQNKKLAKPSQGDEEQKAKTFLQNCMTLIKPMPVINPYAGKVMLPMEAKLLRSLNGHFQAFVRQITLLHQYQRKRDKEGRLISEPSDIKIACEILFDSIMLKVDDLHASLRCFFEQMKLFVLSSAKAGNINKTEMNFTQREIRLNLNVSKASCFRYMEELELLEYVQKTGGYANRGFKYRIVFWDDMEKIKTKINEELTRQLNDLTI